MTNQESVDELTMYLRGKGYLALSRRFSNYLPEPQPVGEYKIDAVGKYKKNYAIGFNVSEDDLRNPQLISKITFLANRQMRQSNNKAQLFIGIPSKLLIKFKNLLAGLDPLTLKNIRFVPISEHAIN